MFHIKPLLLTLTLTLGACASKQSSILTGAAIGGATGTVLGHQQKGNEKARIVGGASGMMVGGLIGYLYNRQAKERRSKKQNVKADLKSIAPNLTRSKVSMYWEPDKIDGNKFVEKHRVWVLESGPHWTR